MERSDALQKTLKSFLGYETCCLEKEILMSRTGIIVILLCDQHTAALVSRISSEPSLIPGYKHFF